MPMLVLGCVGAVAVVVTAVTAYLFQGSWSLLVACLELVGLLVAVKRKTRQVQQAPPRRRGGGGVSWSVVDMLDECVARHPERPMMILADSKQTVTFREMNERADRVARWLVHEVKAPPGSTVALLMPSCADYVAIWLGVAKAGCSSALLNTNLGGGPLVHAIQTALADSPTRLVICGEALAPALEAPQVRAALLAGFLEAPTEGPGKGPVTVTVWGADATSAEAEAEAAYNPLPAAAAAAEASAGGAGGAGGESEVGGRLLPQGGPVCSAHGAEEEEDGPPRRAGLRWDTTLFFIYTSGTTGLPKASKINHLRFWSAGCVVRRLCHLVPSDRLYSALPLYHASGGMMAVSACLQTGACLVLRPKFSVSQFSRDIAVHRCTSMQYIGELCRYLASAPPTPLDGSQHLKYAIGNGLRPDVWERFVRRYNVGRVVEFYAATEGNANLFNNTNLRVGAVGLVPWFARSIYPVKLAKYDEKKGDLVRDPSTGLCVECAPGEVGQVLGLIDDRDPSRKFDGYTDPEATKKKVAESVFTRGDRYFLSGDLMRQDAWGFFYWHDRAGDTFRWRGENCSTAEVASVVALVLGDQVADVNVYGVEVEHTDGRAGMAALALADGTGSGDVDWGAFFLGLGAAGLAPYAQPLFLRVASEGLEYTATFKHKKEDLRSQGFDPSAMGGDEVFFRDANQMTYVPLTPDLHRKITAGMMRL